MFNKPEIDVLLGLFMAVAYGADPTTAIFEKATEFNRNVSPTTRKNLIIPIMHSGNPLQTLTDKTDEFMFNQANRGF